MLAKFGKRSPDDMAAAVQDMQLTAIGTSEINTLKNLLPQPEEIEAVRNAGVPAFPARLVQDNP